MTVTADDYKRVILPGVKPRDRFDYAVDSEGRIILRRLEPVPREVEAPRPKPRLVRRKDGSTVFVGGPPVNSEIVKRMLEDFP